MILEIYLHYSAIIIKYIYKYIYKYMHILIQRSSGPPRPIFNADINTPVIASVALKTFIIVET